MEVLTYFVLIAVALGLAPAGAEDGHTMISKAHLAGNGRRRGRR